MIKTTIEAQISLELTQRGDQSHKERFDDLLAQITTQTTSLLVDIARQIMDQEHEEANRRKAALLDSNQIGQKWNNRETIQ
jgi:hypothetical protein